MFVTVSIFSNFLMYIQFPSKKRLQTIFVVTNVVFFRKKSPIGLEVSLEENDQMRRSGFSGSAPTPAQVDVEGSDLDGFLLLTCELVDFLCVLFSFSEISDFSLNLVHPFLGRFC